MKIFKKQGITAERPHLNIPEGCYEEELGLDGFYGRVSHLYHENPPTSWSDLRSSEFQWPEVKSIPAPSLRPQCFKPSVLERHDFFSSGEKWFWNQDVALWVHRFSKSEPIYFRNADANELFFLHAGEATLESVFGELKVASGDYIVIPKGVTYRWKISAPVYFLRFESFEEFFEKPDTGLMGQQALYHESGIRSTELASKLSEESSSLVRIQNQGALSEVEYAFDIRKVRGWFGDLYPYALNVKDIAPAMSPIAHLPPSVNSTFVTKNFVVCSFLPRPLEEPKGALKVPFFHSNIDYDEIIFYHAGDFFSRDHMEAGSITLHPKGIHHGPHPKALENQHQMTRTNEIAVMLDTRCSLQVGPAARDLEIKEYWKSWNPKI